MYDVMDIIQNIENIYESNNAFSVLKDFERVLDELDIYVYDNWEVGELVKGPDIKRHWVSCSFMWPKDKMPNREGAKRLLDYDCRVHYQKTYLVEPRKIREPGDMRPGTKKGKLDRKPVWVVHIKMPSNLIADTYNAYIDQITQQPDTSINIEEPAMEAPVEPDLGGEMPQEGGL